MSVVVICWYDSLRFLQLRPWRQLFKVCLRKYVDSGSIVIVKLQYLVGCSNGDVEVCLLTALYTKYLTIWLINIFEMMYPPVQSLLVSCWGLWLECCRGACWLRTADRGKVAPLHAHVAVAVVCRTVQLAIRVWPCAITVMTFLLRLVWGLVTLCFSADVINVIRVMGFSHSLSRGYNYLQYFGKLKFVLVGSCLGW